MVCEKCEDTGLVAVYRDRGNQFVKRGTTIKACVHCKRGRLEASRLGMDIEELKAPPKERVLEDCWGWPRATSLEEFERALDAGKLYVWVAEGIWFPVFRRSHTIHDKSGKWFLPIQNLIDEPEKYWFRDLISRSEIFFEGSRFRIKQN